MPVISRDAAKSSFDFVELNLDKVPSKELKSSEQIRRHSIDATLESKPVEKALYIFTAGEEVQKLSVLQSIPELFKEDQTGCLQRLLPKMQQTLPTASTEFHVTASQAVKSLIEKKVIPVDTFVHSFLQMIIQSMDNRDPAVANAWVQTLLDIMNYLPMTVLQNDVTPVAIQRSLLQKSIPVRLSSCKILGALATRFSGVELKREILPTILSLCQDVNPDVRAAMCSNLPVVAKQLGPEGVKTNLLPSIIELSADEMPKVKETAYETIVEIIPYVSNDVIRNALLPLLKQTCAYAFKFDENLLVVVAANYGKMVIGLEKVTLSAEKENYVKTYIALAELGSSRLRREKGKDRGKDDILASLHGFSAHFAAEKFVMCRQFCAYNYPALAKFCYDEKNKQLIESLHVTFSNLAVDPYYMVRRTIACSLLEVANIYGKYVYLLKNDVIRLLRDDAEEVLDGFIPRLGPILAILVKSGVIKTADPTDSTATELTRGLIKSESMLTTSHNWRLYCSFVEQLENLWSLYPTDNLYNNFVLLLIKRTLSVRNVPVRTACMKSLLVNMRYIQKLQHRADVRTRIINDLACSNNFYDRMFYLRSCELIMDIFSTSFFKEHFFVKTVQMAGDPVPNIRWAVCRLLPKLSSMIKLPADKKLQDLIESSMSQLSTDKDREVLSMLAKGRQELSRRDTKTFPNDAQKYEEEKKLVGMAKVASSPSPLPGPSLALAPPPTTTRGGTSSYGGASQGMLAANRRGSSISSDNRRATAAPFTSGRSPPSTTRGRGYPSNAFNEFSFNDKTFLVDTGVKMLTQRGAESQVTIQPVRSPSAKTKTSEDGLSSGCSTDKKECRIRVNIENTKLSPNKKTIGKQNIPIRRKTEHKDGENRDVKKSEKRHSIGVIDVNKNVTEEATVEGDKKCVIRNRITGRKSQLPRPLSVTFPVRPATVGADKAITLSKLPVSRPESSRKSDSPRR